MLDSSEYVIGIDLGSNTLRVAKFDCKSGEFVAEYEKIVRTAEGLNESKRVSQEALNRILQALSEAKSIIDFDGAKIRAVTTEAMRQASNKEEILSQIETKSGVSFEIISANEEAQLTLLAVKERLKELTKEEDSFVLIDIGGGSTELIFVYPQKVIIKSFKLGILTLSQEAKGWENIKNTLPKKLPPIEKFVDEIYKTDSKVKSFISTAGTPTTLAALKLGMDYESYDAKRINGTSIKRQELAIFLNQLLHMPIEQRQKAVGVGREDLILAGILIFEALFDLLAFEESIVIDDGLREGVARSLCPKV